MENQASDDVNKSPERITVFRVDDYEWLYDQLRDGCLRQGWGAPGFELTQQGGPVDKVDWEESYRKTWKKDPSSRRFAILRRMLDINRGDVVVVPKMPKKGQFSIARVSDGYRFDLAPSEDDYGHIVPVDPESVRTFNCQANEDAYLVSAIFARACHRPAISHCYDHQHIAAALRLLDKESGLEGQPLDLLDRAQMDIAYWEAAKSLQREVKTWNGGRFEKAVRQAFRDQGYNLTDHPHYDGVGGDVDIVASPPIDRFHLFLEDTPDIAIQVKWYQGTAEAEHAIGQLDQWVKSQHSNAQKVVISSASKFTEKSQIVAEDSRVRLISGLQTMCFLLGFPERYREEWDDS